MHKFLLLLVLYLPFQIALNPSEGVDLASIRVLIILVFAVWLMRGLKNRKLAIQNTLQTWLLMTFIFLNAFSLFFARNTEWSLRKLVFLFSLLPIYFVVDDIVNNEAKKIKLLKYAVVSGIGVALIGIIQFALQFSWGLEKTYKFWAKSFIGIFLGKNFGEAVLANPSWLVNISGKTILRATATFPDPHMLAFYLGLLLPIAIGLAMVEKTKKSWWLAGAGLLFVADILTFSRGGYLGLFAGIVSLMVVFWSRVQQKYKLLMFGLIIVASVSLLVPSPVSHRFFSSFNLKEGSNQGRLIMWNKAVAVIAEKPLVGAGIGNYPLEVKATASYREPIYAHNTYLDIAAETGIVNALVWASLLAVAGLNFYQKRRRNATFLLAGVSIVIFIVHSMVETGIYSPVVLVLLVILISLSNNNSTDEKMA